MSTLNCLDTFGSNAPAGIVGLGALATSTPVVGADPVDAEPVVEKPYIRLHRSEVHKLNAGRHALSAALAVLVLDPAIRPNIDPMALAQAESALLDHGDERARHGLLAFRLRGVAGQHDA